MKRLLILLLILNAMDAISTLLALQALEAAGAIGGELNPIMCYTMSIGTWYFILVKNGVVAVLVGLLYWMRCEHNGITTGCLGVVALLYAAAVYNNLSIYINYL